MLIVVGLGNPGSQYEHTRHNAGFLTVDALAKQAGASYWKSLGGAQVALVTYEGVEMALVKPQSFMNLSGGPVKNICKELGVGPESLVVVHDELDIPSGTVKVKQGGGHAGHNGLRSLHDKLGTNAYTRVRVGIGRPPGRMNVADYVLSEPRSDARDEFEIAVGIAADAVVVIAKNGVDAAMRQFNTVS